MWHKSCIMNWLLNILDEIKWKAQDVVWSVQDKIQMWKLDKEIKGEADYEVEEIEAKPKKKKAKKKSKNKK